MIASSVGLMTGSITGTEFGSTADRLIQSADADLISVSDRVEKSQDSLSADNFIRRHG